MSQVAADALVAEGERAVSRTSSSRRPPRGSRRAAQCFPRTRSPGGASATRCSAWASRTRPRARSIGRSASRPDSATALWGGAVAHAEVGNKVVAQNYLRRTLALQPTWIDDGARHPAPRRVPPGLDARRRRASRACFGTFSTRTLSPRAATSAASIEVGRIVEPAAARPLHVRRRSGSRTPSGRETERPRVELVLATDRRHRAVRRRSSRTSRSTSPRPGSSPSRA